MQLYGQVAACVFRVGIVARPKFSFYYKQLVHANRGEVRGGAAGQGERQARDAGKVPI
jgi:hypothetical protein